MNNSFSSVEYEKDQPDVEQSIYRAQRSDWCHSGDFFCTFLKHARISSNHADNSSKVLFFVSWNGLIELFDQASETCPRRACEYHDNGALVVLADITEL